MLQLYLVPDLRRDRQLADLVGRCREVLQVFPAVARWVPDEWLHVTVQPINHGVVEPLVLPTRRALVAELAAGIGRVPAFTMRLGSPRPYGAAVIADVADGGPVDVLIERARQIITAVSGPAAVRADSRPAHLTLAYANGEQDSEPVQRALRRHVWPSHAPMTVAEVELVEVEQDPQQCVYRWTKVRTFPLARERHVQVELGG